MEERPRGRGLYPFVLACWLAAFAAESLGLALAGAALERAVVGLEGAAAAIDREAGLNRAFIDGTLAAAADLEFLQGLPNILPQDRAYLRTQKAISDEVQALRQKLSRGLKGSLHVVIDAKTNTLYLKQGFKLLWQADCSVGRGGMLYDKRTGQRWEFVTPRGEFRVIGKTENPLWRKPDWAYVEAGEPVPPPEAPERLVTGELGPYVLNLGDGYLIHGTRNEKVLGRPASHGCVRLGSEDLKKLYETVPLGTRVFIFY